MVQPLWKAVCRYLRKLKMDLPVDPAIPLLGIYPKEAKTLISRNVKHPNVHCSIIYNCQDIEAAQCPSVDEWIKQLWDIYTMEYNSAIKKEKILPFVTV